MQPEKETFPSANTELSDIWQELLGGHPLYTHRLDAPDNTEKVEATELIQETAAPSEAIPTLPTDPWSALVQARGTEMVDLSQLHLHMSDQDVEQALRLMQEDQ